MGNEKIQSSDQAVKLSVGVNEKIHPVQAGVLGLQHVLAMDLYIVPVILAGILAMSTSDTALLIQVTFIGAGLATLIQVGLGIKLPVVQGPSYVPLGALGSIGATLGLPAMAGSLIPGAILIGILGFPLKLFGKAIAKIIPPIVAGTVIIVVGIGLMPVAINEIYHAPGKIGDNGLLAFISATLLILFLMLGARIGGKLKFLRTTSVILALVLGTVVANFFGLLDFSTVSSAPWFSLPGLFPFGMPKFDLSAILTMVFIYFIVLIETTGTWYAVGAVTGEKIDEKRINAGAMGEGLGCFTGALFGSMPVTGYSTNAGVISITGIGSKMAVFAAGIILVFLGLMPKLMNLIASIPLAVIYGVFSIVCVIIAMNGFRIIKQITLNERNMLVIGIPIVLTLFAALMPKELLYSLPSLISYIVSSGIAVGALAAVILNLVLPAEKEEK